MLFSSKKKKKNEKNVIKVNRVTNSIVLFIHPISFYQHPPSFILLSYETFCEYIIL